MTAPMGIAVPGSKSETQRALMLAALAGGESEIVRPLECDDSRALRRALRALGVGVHERAARWRVRGCRLHAPAGPIDCRDGGTTARFVGPLCLLFDGELVLDGSSRLRARPIAELVAALTRLDVAARHLGAPDMLPVSFRRRAPAAHARLSVGTARSSQFASGLLLVGPLLPDGLTLELDETTVSRPYLELTVEMMRRFGAQIEPAGCGYRVASGEYRATELRIGGDWSSAALLLAGAFVVGREVVLEGVDPESAQPDRAIVRLLGELRRPGAHTFDLSDCPDLLPPLAVAAAHAVGAVEIRGVRHARLKESDRPAVLARELARAGVRVVEQEDGLRIEPGGTLRPAQLDPHGDHRMAMAFGLLSLREPRITSLEPECVSKSYPTFWSDLERLR
jgi:3-phosphoshikimate 1-carboxyvinyltransferase